MHTKQVLVRGRGEGQAEAGAQEKGHPLALCCPTPKPHFPGTDGASRWLRADSSPGGGIRDQGSKMRGRAGDRPPYLDVDEDDLYVFRFEEPLQGLHEVLQGGERWGRWGPFSSPVPERQGQGVRDGERRTERPRGKETEIRREERERLRQGDKGRQEKRDAVGECAQANMHVTVHAELSPTAASYPTTRVSVDE